MWILTLALALAQSPCGPGLLLAADGRCAGSTAPWALTADFSIPSHRLLADGRLLLQSSAWDEDIPRLSFHLLHPQTGALQPIAHPFGAGWVWSIDPADPTLVLGPYHYDPTTDPPTATLEGGLRRLDPATGVWIALAPWPAPDPGASGARLADGSVVMVGGAAPSAAAWRYDPSTNAWNQLPDGPTPRNGPVAIGLSDRSLLVCSGSSAPGMAAEPTPVPGCDRWDGSRWKAVDRTERGILVRLGTVGDAVVLWDRGERLTKVSQATGTFEPGPGLPAADLRPASTGDDGVWFQGEARQYRLAPSGWTEVPIPEAEHAVPLALPHGWLLLRRSGPPQVVRGAEVVELDTGWFPEGAPWPGGGLVLVGRQSTVRMMPDGDVRGLPTHPGDPHSIGVVVLEDGTVVTLGGSDGNGVALRSVDALAPGADTWQSLPPLPMPLNPRPLEPLPVATDGRRVWAFGGPEGQRIAAWRDPDQPGWSLAAAPAFEPMIAVAVGPRVWVLGRPERGEQQAAWLEPDGTWTAIGTPPIPHLFPATTLLSDGGILLAGGKHDNDNLLGCTHATRFDPTSGAWRPLPEFAESRSGGSAIELGDGRVLHVGGDRARVQWLAADRSGWVMAPPTLRHRGRPVLARLSANRVAIAGDGRDNNEAAELELYHPGSISILWPDLSPQAEADAARARCLAGTSASCSP